MSSLNEGERETIWAVIWLGSALGLGLGLLGGPFLVGLLGTIFFAPGLAIISGIGAGSICSVILSRQERKDGP